MKTARTSSLPILYTHPIGSLPRPQAVRDLLGRRDELGEDRFTGMLDDMVRFAIHLQELAGLDVVSDGEWRRVQYIREFLSRIGGFERCRRYRHQGEEKTKNYHLPLPRSIESSRDCVAKFTCTAATACTSGAATCGEITNRSCRISRVSGSIA